jgi:enoyl-CoA hydratase/carnithine racemase
MSATGIESGFERLVVEREAGGVVRVWLARPEKLNALDTRTLEEVIGLYGSFERDFSARVVVLGGHGRAFCAGADRGAPPGTDYLLTGQGATPRERRWWAQLGRRAVAAIADAEVVTIARLHGYVLGGGLCLAVACDFRIATPDAQLGLPEVDLGLPLTWGGTARLVHEVGAARTRELIMLADNVDGVRAEAIGLVHRVVPPDELDVVVTDWATRLAGKPEVAIHMAKTQLRALAARQAGLGDTTETDGDLLLAASSGGAALAAFGGPPSRRE